MAPTPCQNLEPDPDTGERVADRWYADPLASRKSPDGIRLRKAIQLCWNECPQKARMACLTIGLTPGPTLEYGVFGGYTPKQRQEMVAEIELRKAEGRWYGDDD